MSILNSNLKFAPERIASAASSIANEGKRLRTCKQEIRKQLNAMGRTWKGNGSELYSECVSSLEDRTDRFLEQLQILEQELWNVAGVYKAGEALARQEAESLPTDGIFLV